MKYLLYLESIPDPPVALARLMSILRIRGSVHRFAVTKILS